MSPVNGQVDRVARTVVERSANGVTRIVAGVAAHPILGALPLKAMVPGVDGAIRNAIDLLKEDGVEETIVHATDALNGRVSKLAGGALRRATGLLAKVLGTRRGPVLTESETLLGQGIGDPATAIPLVVNLMGRLFDQDDVIARASEAIADVGWAKRHVREGRLEKLRHSNELWVRPVTVLAHGLGPLWLVPLPIGVPLAPLAAAVLLVWVVLISGDQLDTRRPAPDFWKGVVRRSKGE
jgi:hypothetical protein